MISEQKKNYVHVKNTSDTVFERLRATTIGQRRVFAACVVVVVVVVAITKIYYSKREQNDSNANRTGLTDETCAREREKTKRRTRHANYITKTGSSSCAALTVATTAAAGGRTDGRVIGRCIARTTE